MRQACQGLPHARAADTKDVGQLVFAKLGAWRQPVFENSALYARVDFVGCVFWCYRLGFAA
jgi:hypothetical protein